MAKNTDNSFQREEFFMIVRTLFPQSTQKSFGEFIGVDQGTISKWSNGTLPVPYYAKVIVAYMMERSEGGFDPLLDVDSYFRDHP